jgi:hypothetical protein
MHRSQSDDSSPVNKINTWLALRIKKRDESGSGIAREYYCSQWLVTKHISEK